jgi:hypothetical protein
MASKHRAGRKARRPRYVAFSRETDLSRRVELQDEFRSMLVATNGKSSEVEYFRGIKTESWISVGKVVVQFINSDPTSLIMRAAAIRDENDYDETWAVCDLDEFDVALAVVEAEVKDVGLALSVPSFEVWLILHLSVACPGFNDARQVDRHLKGILPTWDKTNLRFADFQTSVWLAVARAKQLGEPPQANPSTAVWKVIESLARPAAETANQSDQSLSQNSPHG